MKKLNIEVNYIAVFLAAVMSMVAGFVWYSPMVLGKPWMKEKGYTMEGLKKEQQQMGKLYGLSFVVALITAFVLSHVTTLSQDFYQTSRFSAGLSSAFWMWLGFIMPVQTTDSIFGDKNWRLLAINTGYQLVALMLMGITIGLM